MFDFSTDRQSAGGSPRIVALRQAKQSAEARQRDLYDSHRHRTFALAYYMTGNELEAEQILTSTFVEALSAVEEPTRDDVDSALLQQLRQRFPLRPETSTALSPVSADSAASSGELADRNVKRTDLEEAIQELPPVERLLFLLRDVEGYTSAAIAQLLKWPEPQVQRTLFAARLHMRRILAQPKTCSEEQAA
ncbi:MAG TPA: sigma-70 family RNA polymerase sigma factor [Silvibacterium sp.]|nr:sigma-70 family RNA polymerase sigma factor [Silvibacterium sp.]